jgi:tRNA dimethylallyltransferase
MNASPSHIVRIIAGPTASGKSQLAIDIAKEKGGVIINADSQQVYRDVPILTAQPNAEEQAVVPHRLYGFLEGKESLNAAAWARRAAQEIETVWHENRLPVVVGGTGLYLRTLIDGISPVPDIDEAVRTQVRARMQEMGSHAFHAELTQSDPTMAEKLRPSDSQRLMRAAEVLESTGKSLSYWHSIPPKPLLPVAQFEVTLVNIPHPELYRRCNERFVKMLEMGAVDEVRNLFGGNASPDRVLPSLPSCRRQAEFFCGASSTRRGSLRSLPPESPLCKIIGVRELASYLAGDVSLEDAVTLAQQMTRNYAKRQMTWFRNQKLGTH